MTTVSENPRLVKGRCLAAAPGAVVRIRERDFKVRGSGGNYYNVHLVGGAWRCSCPDFERGKREKRHCKHIHAVTLTLEALAECERYIQENGIDTEALAAMLSAKIRDTDPEDTAALKRLRTLFNAATLPAVKFELRYWWLGADPEALLDPEIALEGPSDGYIEVRTPINEHWRLSKYDIDALRDYIVDQDLHVIEAIVEQTRRRGGWEARFILTLATNGYGQFTHQQAVPA